MSAAESSPSMSSRPASRPPNCSASASARSRRRLAMNTVCTPRSASARAVSSAISPVPRTTTRRSHSAPIVSCARSTATEGTLTRRWESAVSERTRLPVASAAPNMRLVNGPVMPASSASS